MTVYRTMSEEQATNLIRAHAAAIGTAVGVDARQTENLMSKAACENAAGERAEDGRFYMQGNWLMPLPPHEHAAVLLRLHDDWAAQGYQIKKFEMFSEDEGVIIAENPVDEVELWLESGVPPIALAVVIMTPCYRPN